MVASLGLNLSAQQHNYTYRHIDERATEQMLEELPARDFQVRTKPTRVLPTKQHLLGYIGRHWTDGVYCFVSLYFEDKRTIEFMQSWPNDLSRHEKTVDKFKVAGNAVTVKDKKGIKVTVEQIGAYEMLVERNAQGKPVKAYYNMSNEQFNNGYWSIFVQMLMAGRYTMANQEDIIFGPRLKHYGGNKYDNDPGIFAYQLADDYSNLHILYGDRRVSHGDPSSPKYGMKMPGAGGAGALMPPMEWRVRFTTDGLAAIVTKDQPFVDHNPPLMNGNKSETKLTKVASPHEGLNGKWTFASVIPLTHELVKLFPKEVLTLIKGEIYARHGDTFANPQTQKYFDAQPWYKKSGKKVVLTDVERFNIALINQAIQ